MIVRRSIIAVAGLLLAGLTAQPAVADTVAYYRYRIATEPPAPAKYVGRLPSAIGVTGHVIAVSTDALGRITKVVTYHDGVAISETDYEYLANARYFTNTRTSRGGEVTGSSTYARDASGHITRVDSYTIEGVLTSYATVVITPGREDDTYYTPAGTITRRETDFYSPEGSLLRKQNFESETVYYQDDYDTSNGLLMSSLKFENGKVVVKQIMAFDSNADIKRVDLYDPSTNSPYGFREYSNNLLVRTSYQFTSGDRKEILYYYDAKRLLAKSTLTYNGKIVCTFTFDRQPDGTIKRTLAIGPNGELYAEYPNAEMLDVNRDGTDPDGGPGTIYKTGNWF